MRVGWGFRRRVGGGAICPGVGNRGAASAVVRRPRRRGARFPHVPPAHSEAPFLVGGVVQAASSLPYTRNIESQAEKLTITVGQVGDLHMSAQVRFVQRTDHRRDGEEVEHLRHGAEPLGPAVIPRNRFAERDPPPAGCRRRNPIPGPQRGTGSAPAPPRQARAFARRRPLLPPNRALALRASSPRQPE